MLELVQLEVVGSSSFIELVLDVGRHVPLLREDGKGKVVQRGLAVRVQEVGHVAVATAVALDQRVLVLPSLVWVYLIWSNVTYVAIFFIIDISISIVEVQLLGIFVLNSDMHKVLEQVEILGLDRQHQQIIAVGCQLP